MSLFIANVASVGKDGIKADHNKIGIVENDTQ
jgi:hypothetical protein